MSSVLQLMLCLQATSSPPAGHEATEKAMEKVITIPKPPLSALLTTSGVLATWLSHGHALDRREFAEREVEFALADGTRIGGLLFRREGEAPLVLASFGFLADRWSKPAAQFVGDFVADASLAAHVLILDHPSSAPFLAANGELSVGGLDEGRILLGVASELRAGRAAELGMRITSYHLLGVSMGGLGVLYALRFDARGDRPIFGSAVVFSSVTRLDEVPADQLLNRGEVRLAPGRKWRFSPAGLLGRGIYRDLLRHFRESYRDRTGRPLEGSDEDLAQLVYGFMERRARHVAADGEGSASFASLDSYMKANNLCDRGEEVAVPLVLIHSKDDPVVPVSHLECFQRSASRNSNVTTYATNNGGHWGFARTYGRDWIASVLDAVMRAGTPRLAR